MKINTSVLSKKKSLQHTESNTSRSESTLKKNLLLISPIPSGLFSFFLEGKEEFSGMPAFKEVFLSVLNDSRLQVLHLILFITAEQQGKIRLPEKYKERIRFYPIVFDIKKPVISILRLLKGIWLGIRLVKKHDIQKVGGYRSHGSAMAALIAFFTGIYDVRRIYGTFLINEVAKPKWKLFLQHPLEYISFAMPGGALFVTNDGTKGDIVFNKIGSKKIDFQFLLNGIDKNIEKHLESPEIDLPEGYMSYIARITTWKRQHLLVEALKILSEEGVDFPPSLIIGPVTHQEYYEDLKSKVKTYRLEDKVKIITGLPSSQCHFILKNSLFSFSLYHTSNLGNVFLEAISLGTPMIAINDTASLSRFPKDIFLELPTEDPAQIAAMIKSCISNPTRLQEISKAAREYASEHLLSWTSRAGIEVEALLS